MTRNPLRQKEIQDVKKPVIRYAASLGWEYHGQNSQGDKANPDGYFTKKMGRIVFVEFKRPGKAPRKLQSYKIDRLIDQGFTACYIDTVANGKRFFDTLENIGF